MESADRDIGEREAISAGETRRNIGAVGDIITGLKNKGKTMHFEHENGPFLALIGPFLAQIIFFENRASSLFYTHRRLTCCKKSEKSYSGK